MKQVLMSLISILAFTSCDYMHTKDYYILNRLDTNIEAQYSVNGLLQAVNLPKESKTLIFKDEYPFGTVGVSDARYEDLVSNVIVFKDTIKMELDESQWKYSQLDKYHAEYVMAIDSLTL